MTTPESMNAHLGSSATERESDGDEPLPNICASCDGTGLGQYDGWHCHSCNGSGTLRRDRRWDDYELPEPMPFSGDDGWHDD